MVTVTDSQWKCR